MKIEFTQIYSEPGASFNLPGPLLGAVSDALETLDKQIPQLAAKFADGEFELVLIISASSKLLELDVRGPNIRRKAREVEFSLFMPWQRTEGFVQEVHYVLPMIGEGLRKVLERYGVDSSGVRTAIEALIVEARKTPEMFQYPHR